MTRRRSGAGSGSGRHTRPRGARAQRSHAAGAIDGWWDAPPRLLVTTADEARAADRHAIEADGVPSRALMQRAGAAAAARIISQVADRLEHGVVVFCGGGNNGGDGWVIARALADAGVRVRVDEVIPARSPDCRSERALALPLVRRSADHDGERIAVDAILGTGSSGAPRGTTVEGLARLADSRRRGAIVFAVDVPSGLDATTGAAEGVVRADETITFGTVKRGLLAARDHAGRITVLDIGLSGSLEAIPDAPRLTDAALVRLVARTLPASAHKGSRGKLAIVGGAAGMAGAVVLATRAALRTSAGMTRALVDGPSVPVLQAAVPAATCATWPADDDSLERDIGSWADGVVLGPGLGRTNERRALVERVLQHWRGPVLLDADALNVFEGETELLGRLLRGRPAAVTPHVAEFARLAGGTPDDALGDPYAAARELASRLGAIVLLKGVPTVVAAPDSRCMVSATGTSALATAGSGDVLAGIAGTFLMQNPENPLEALAAAAWAHGRAGELASARGTRGVLLESILDALAGVWEEPLPAPGALSLLELPDPSEPRVRREGAYA